MEHTEPQKTVLSRANGRMVTLEEISDAEACTLPLLRLAQEGCEEGRCQVARLPVCPLGESGAPGLFVSLLVRPSLHAQMAGRLSAACAVATLRAIEQLSDIDLRIRWVNDLFYRAHKVAGMMASASLKPNGYLDYVVLGITVNLSEDNFPPRLGNVIRRVFNGETRPLPTCLSEGIVREFFSIYDRMATDDGFLDEYRRRSLLLGQYIKVLVGDTYLRGRVIRIDENACLEVELHSGARMTVTSRSEVLF